MFYLLTLLVIFSGQVTDTVVYTVSKSRLFKPALRLDIPLYRRVAESRAIIGDEMYAGGVKNLEIEDRWMNGTMYLAYLRELSPDCPIKRESFAVRTMNLIFGRPPDEEPEVVLRQDGKDYIRVWIVMNGKHHRKILTTNDFEGRAKPQCEAIPKLKSKVINEQSVLVPNELLEELFRPVMETVCKTYEYLVNY